MRTSRESRKHYWFIATFLSLLMLTTILGCTSAFESRRVNPKSHVKHDDSQREGIAYFLPLGRVHIYAVRNIEYITNVLIIPGPNGDMLQSRNEYITNTVTRITSSANPVTQQSLLAFTSSGAATNTTTYATTNKDGTPILLTNTVNQTINTSNAPVFFTTNSTVTTSVTNTVIWNQPFITTNYNYTMVISNDYSADHNNLFLLHPG